MYSYNNDNKSVKKQQLQRLYYRSEKVIGNKKYLIQ